MKRFVTYTYRCGATVDVEYVKDEPGVYLRLAAFREHVEGSDCPHCEAGVPRGWLADTDVVPPDVTIFPPDDRGRVYGFVEDPTKRKLRRG